MSEPTPPTSRSSVELHRHKDGSYWWDIKIYQGEGMTLEMIMSDIDSADATLTMRYAPRTPA